MSNKYANWLSTAVGESKYGIVLFWAHFTTTNNTTDTGRSSKHNYTNSTRIVLISSEDLEGCLDQWKRRCIAMDGEYFKGDKIDL
jgi:hypothetical protein